MIVGEFLSSQSEIVECQDELPQDLIRVHCSRVVGVAILRGHVLRSLPVRVQGFISADDVVQETLTRVFPKIDQLLGNSRQAFVAWLLAIGDMTLIDLIRRETAQARGGRFQQQGLPRECAADSLAELFEDLHADDGTGSHIAARKEGIEALQVAIAGLPWAHTSGGPSCWIIVPEPLSTTCALHFCLSICAAWKRSC